MEVVAPACRRIDNALRRAGAGAPRLLLAAALTAAIALGAGKAPTIRVDTWAAAAPGVLDLSATWRRYPPQASAFTDPPAVVQDDGRPVLRLATTGEALRIGRPLKVDVSGTPVLTWEWKPLILPEGGDVRNPKRNDQTGRVMVMFEGMKALLYVWDTTAPVGTVMGPDPLDLFQRALIVVRSGPAEAGRWHQERRDVRQDYLRVFEEDPPAIKWVGLESHSNDTNTRTAILFGHVSFESR